MKLNTIYLGNNLEILKTFPDNSVDCVVTDPPYGLGKEPNAIEVLQSWITTGYHEVKGKGFMGKEWDAFVPQPNFWKEIYRVLKPGGYVLSFAGTRTYDWMVMAIRLAGFEIRDMIAWLYGSGFPKSQNISIFIDKSKKLQGHRGKATHAFLVGNKRAEDGKEIEASKRMEAYEPKSDEAKQWQGWGTALKPALEPIVMARKPLNGTVAQNVLKHGVGGINIDECRVGEGRDKEQTQGVSNSETQVVGRDENNVKTYSIDLGRFPANVIHDGSEEVVSLFPYTESGNLNEGHKRGDGTGNSFMGGGGTIQKNYGGDSGSASRFFYTAKASQEERNFGLYDFEDVEVRGGGGRVKQGYDENNEEDMRLKESARKFGAVKTSKKNIHPTVKPIDLMRYLVRLVTPKNGICLDPYLGSGTTAIACEMEKFSWIGI
ncbi:MAG: DNA methyltransferase, partial [Bacilli bacterium]|nr:DNA methyltransferase [Bacilli bacterium]